VFSACLYGGPYLGAAATGRVSPGSSKRGRIVPSAESSFEVAAGLHIGTCRGVGCVNEFQSHEWETGLYFSGSAEGGNLTIYREEHCGGLMIGASLKKPSPGVNVSAGPVACWNWVLIDG
jgi:hypothetical protein